MKEIPTPLTDKLHKHLVKLSEDQRTWIKGKDYVAVREHARQLERDRHELKEALELLKRVMDESVKVGCTDHLDCWDDCPWYDAQDKTSALLERMKP